jgi:hypothetical protein
MDAFSPYEPPNPFDGIKVRTIRRQEIEPKQGKQVFSPFMKQLGMMISGIVQDYHDAPPGWFTGTLQFLEKIKEGQRVKTVGLLLKHKLPVTQAHCPQIADVAMGGMVQENRIASLRRHPHATA